MGAVLILSAKSLPPGTLIAKLSIVLNNLKGNNMYLSKKLGIQKIQGSVGGPLLMWFLGVPGVLVLVIWLFFFRGK